MELYTKNDQSGIKLPLCHRKDDVLSISDCSVYRIIFIKSGSGIVRLNNNSIIFMGPCVFCLNEKDRIELEQGIKVNAELICFNPDFINNGLTIDKINDDSSVYVGTELQDIYCLQPFVLRDDNYFGLIDLGPAIEQKLSYLFNNINKEINRFSNYFWYCQSRAVFLEIILLIQHSYKDTINEESIRLTKVSKEIREVIVYIHSNYHNRITIEELTSRFHINRTTLSVRFKEATGLSIIDYTTKLRIKVAGLLLKETALPITDIIYETGFSESNHFCRMFKRYTGYTPTDYRKKILNQS